MKTSNGYQKPNYPCRIIQVDVLFQNFSQKRMWNHEDKLSTNILFDGGRKE